MKNIFMIGVLMGALPLLAAPTDKQSQLAKHIEEKVIQVQGQNVNNVSFDKVMQELQEAKKVIKQNMKFPTHVQDNRLAGVIFGRFMPLMYSYNRLRSQDAVSAQTAGAVIMREVFVSQDGKEFKIDEFIEQYVSSVTITDLAQEFVEFKEHIRQDAIDTP